MGRIHLLFGGFLFYLLGVLTAVAAGYPPSPDLILLGYTILCPAHLSVHFSNDSFDLEGDRLGKPTAVSGGSGVLPLRPDLQRRARDIALLLMGISFLLGIWAYFTVLPTPGLPAILVLGNGIGWFYSAPPVRLSARGLGEAATACAIGILIPGMGYLAVAGGLDATFLIASLPLIFLGIAFILAVELPDREADALSGKRTFIVRHGVMAGLRVIPAAAVLATSLYLALFLAGEPPGMPWGAPALASLVPLAAIVTGLPHLRGQGGLAPFAERTVFSLIFFAVLADAGILLAPSLG
jgi:1,4-dihydroxy-2-naphthoate octaprenyltransferase